MNPLRIRWRIALWNTAAFAIVLCGFGYLVYSQLSATHYDQLDQTLRTRYEAVIGDGRLGATPRRRFQGWIAQFGEHASISGVLIDDDGVIVSTAGPVADIIMPPVPAELSRAPTFDTVSPDSLGRLRRLSVILPDDRQKMTAIMLTSLNHMDEELSLVAQTFLIAVPLTLVLATILAYGLAVKSLAPVEHLRQMADEITAEHLDRRLPVPNPNDELGHLAQTINSMIGRLEASFDEIRRFTADASHELRTPVTVIRSEAEMGADLSADHEPARLRFLSIVEECTRLTAATNQLLTLSRDDAGMTQPHLKTFDISRLLAHIVEARRPLAEAQQLRLLLETPQSSITVSSDPERLRQVFENLIDNAIKYTPAGGTVTVIASPRADAVEVSVRDTGIGIEDVHLPRLFDRFYRVNKDSSFTGGAGLGLSIVASILKTLHSRIEVESSPGEGSTFRVFLPRTEASVEPAA